MMHFSEMIGRIASESRGNIAILAAISLLSLSAAMTSAIDLAIVAQKDAKFSALLDSAVLSALTIDASEADIAQNATDQLNALVSGSGISAQGLSVDFVFDSGVLRGTATAQYKTIILGLMGVPYVTLSAKAAGRVERKGDPLCIHAMHPTFDGALALAHPLVLDAPDCNVFVNSSSSAGAVDLQHAQNQLHTRSIRSVGPGSGYVQNINPSLETANEPMADPLADLEIPQAGNCDYVNLELDNSDGRVRLDPGTYCGGLLVRNHARITLLPGTHIFIDGDLSVQNDSILRGSEVTLVLGPRGENNAAELRVHTSRLILDAPKTGPYAGYAILSERIESIQIFSSATIDIHGVVYLPKAILFWGNISPHPVAARWTAWLFDAAGWFGNGTLPMRFDIESSDVPYPDALRVYDGGIITTVLVE